MSKTIAEIAKTTQGFAVLDTLLENLKEGNKTLWSVFNDKNSKFTVLAPTDEAFIEAVEQFQKTKKFPPGNLMELLAKPEVRKIMISIVKYHVLEGAIYKKDVVEGAKKFATPTTLNGKNLCLSTKGSSVLINGEDILVDTDIKASNGVIHVIKKVLNPMYECKRTM